MAEENIHPVWTLYLYYLLFIKHIVHVGQIVNSFWYTDIVTYLLQSFIAF